MDSSSMWMSLASNKGYAIKLWFMNNGVLKVVKSSLFLQETYVCGLLNFIWPGRVKTVGGLVRIRAKTNDSTTNEVAIARKLAVMAEKSHFLGNRGRAW